MTAAKYYFVVFIVFIYKFRFTDSLYTTKVK